MRVTNERVDTKTHRCDLLVALAGKADFGIKGKKAKPGEIAALDGASGGALLSSLRESGFEAKHLVAESVLVAGAPYTRLMVVGWNETEAEANSQGPYWSFRQLGYLIGAAAGRSKAKSVTLLSDVAGPLGEKQVSALYEGAVLGSYDFDRYKKKESAVEGWAGIEHLILGSRSAKLAKLSVAIAGVEATKLARDLINTCPSDCNPSYLLETCKRVAKKGKLSIVVHDKRSLERMGAGGMLGVSRGSDQPPYLVELSWAPKGAKRSVALVGKGVTFDSGGLSIKPSSGMETMKADMSGAACVIASMQAIAELAPKTAVTGYVAIVENMISGSAMKPGDVISMMDGTTVEVLNTDAEGRLILADALCLAGKRKPDAIIDLATLTGACVVALGEGVAGLFSNDDKLASRLLDSAARAGEPLWRMPLTPEYRDLLKSPVADLKNIGGRWGGAITAALFLQHFAGDSRWAHLDIAGPAFAESDKGMIRRGGVGFGVRTIVDYVLSL